MIHPWQNFCHFLLFLHFSNDYEHKTSFLEHQRVKAKLLNKAVKGFSHLGNVTITYCMTIAHSMSKRLHFPFSTLQCKNIFRFIFGDQIQKDAFFFGGQQTKFNQDGKANKIRCVFRSCMLLRRTWSHIQDQDFWKQNKF